MNPRLQKSCEPKANHAACSANASSALPPQPPSSCFFLRPYLLCRDSPPPPETFPPPIDTIEKKLIPKINKNNSQNISAPIVRSRQVRPARQWQAPFRAQAQKAQYVQNCYLHAAEIGSESKCEFHTTSSTSLHDPRVAYLQYA